MAKLANFGTRARRETQTSADTSAPAKNSRVCSVGKSDSRSDIVWVEDAHRDFVYATSWLPVPLRLMLVMLKLEAGVRSPKDEQAEPGLGGAHSSVV